MNLLSNRELQSTQNHALSALLFLYREVLEKMRGERVAKRMATGVLLIPSLRIAAWTAFCR